MLKSIWNNIEWKNLCYIYMYIYITVQDIFPVLLYLDWVQQPSTGWMDVTHVSHHKLQTLKTQMKSMCNTTLCRFTKLAQPSRRNDTWINVLGPIDCLKSI